MARGLTPDDLRAQREPDRIHMGSLGPGDVALLRDLADAAAETAVNRAFIAMGLDPKEPLKSQQLVGVLRNVAGENADPGYLADRNWVRTWRLRCEGMVGKAFITAVGLATTGGCLALWQGISAAIARSPHH